MNRWLCSQLRTTICRSDNMTTKKRGFHQLREAWKNHYLLLLRLKLHGEQLCQFYCHYHSGSLPWKIKLLFSSRSWIEDTPGIVLYKSEITFSNSGVKFVISNDSASFLARILRKFWLSLCKNHWKIPTKETRWLWNFIEKFQEFRCCLLQNLLENWVT